MEDGGKQASNSAPGAKHITDERKTERKRGRPSTNRSFSIFTTYSIHPYDDDDDDM